MTKDDEHFVKRSSSCQSAKSHVLRQGIYFPLPIPHAPWEDVTLDFIIDLRWSQRNKDLIVVVISQRWHTLFLATPPMMLLKWLICTSKRL